MTILKEKLEKAIEEKNNDIKRFVWKMDRKSGGEEIRLIDATDDQLRRFYNHCQSMLYNQDKINPGRYVLLDIINEQRNKCNTELFLRKIENGSITADKEPCPRYLYIQDLRNFLNKHKEEYPSSELKNIPISVYSKKLPKEFKKIPIDSVLDGGLDQLGVYYNKHITTSFILNMGICFTPEEMKEFIVKDKDGNIKDLPDVIKEKFGIKFNSTIVIKPTGLNTNELRAMINLKTKRYSELTTDQLTILRNKVLFKLENEVNYHIGQWEERIRQIKLVAEHRGISIE